MSENQKENFQKKAQELDRNEQKQTVNDSGTQGTENQQPATGGDKHAAMAPPGRDA
jgi:hypothetical protein